MLTHETLKIHKVIIARFKYVSKDMLDFCIITIVLMVEFTSTHFNGSESSGEVLATLALSEGVSSSNITVLINLNGVTAAGHLL